MSKRELPPKDLQLGLAVAEQLHTRRQFHSTPFFNSATGQVEQWQRQFFTIEENGGFDPGEIHVINHTLSLNTGVKGKFPGGSWDYELTYGHSQSLLESKEPALIAAKAQALYLGPALGTDPSSGLTIYDAPPSRLYTPLTVAQFPLDHPGLDRP